MKPVSNGAEAHDDGNSDKSMEIFLAEQLRAHRQREKHIVKGKTSPPAEKFSAPP